MDLHLCQPLVKDLLTWFHQEARELPWRVVGRNHPNPYHVWLSEIMLQQTTVATVHDYFKDFIAHWPSLQELAEASQDQVLTKWQGLGYYSRARNLHKAAQVLVSEHKGKLPASSSDLAKLPGVGPYTAAAIAAIAFDEAVVPVDGNIARVYARLCHLKTPLPDLLKEVREKVQCLTDQNGHHGDLAQALMDLGARICRPKAPLCEQCPIKAYCQAYQTGDQEQLPVKKPKALKPTRYATAFYLETHNGKIWLQKRPETGLLAGMMEIPSSPWVEDTPKDISCAESPFPTLGWSLCQGEVKHTFTHFHLIVSVWKAVTNEFPLKSGDWYLSKDLKDLALPTLMKKILKVGKQSEPSLFKFENL